MIKLKRYLPFIGFWILNSLLFYLAATLLPQYFELGSATVPQKQAIIWVGLLLTTIVWFSKPLVEGLGLKLKGTATAFIYYWLANTAAIWVLARLAEYSGFGIARFYWAIVLGLVANTGQWILWQVLEPKKEEIKEEEKSKS